MTGQQTASGGNPVNLCGMGRDTLHEVVRDLGVPDDIAPQFWETVRENITVLDDLAGWWALCRDGAEPLIEPEDKDFVAEAMALLPAPPYSGETWGEWTAAVKAATGRKGRTLFQPLRKALTGRADGPDMGRLMQLLQRVRARE